MLRAFIEHVMPVLPGAFIGLSWLVLVVVVLIALRGSIARAVRAIANRIEQGDEVSVSPHGITVKPGESEAQQPRAEAAEAHRDREEEEREDQAGGTQSATAFRRSRAGLFARHFDSRSTSIVVGPSPNCRPRTPESVGTRDAFALAQVQGVLGGPAGVETIFHVVVDERGAEDLIRTRNSIVSIGGPFSNPLLVPLMDALNVPVSFDQGGIWVPDSDAPLMPERRPPAHPTLDHALVFGGRHPGRDVGWFTGVTATYGISTVRAAHLAAGFSFEELQQPGTEGAYAMVLELVNPGLLSTLRHRVIWHSSL
jgi:hypothetical protein